MLNLFQLQHEREDFAVVVHDFLREDSRQGSEV